MSSRIPTLRAGALRSLRQLAAILVVPSLIFACAPGESKGGLDPEPQPTDTTVAALVLGVESVTVDVAQPYAFSLFGRLASGDSVSAAADWSTTGGEVNASGQFLGTEEGDATVTAVGRNQKRPSASASVMVRFKRLVAVVLTPASVSLAPGAVSQFTANGTLNDGSTVRPTVDWSATGGTVSNQGRYVAGSTNGTFRVIARYRYGNYADTSVVTIATTAPPSLSQVIVTPGTASLQTGATQQFSASGRMSDGSTVTPSVNWTATGGTVNSSGLYTAGGTAGTFRIIAVQQGGALADTSAITVTSAAPTLRAVEVTPATATVQTGASQTFTAIGRRTDNSTQAVSVNWTATGGTITGAGVYTAGSTAGAFRVIAVQQGGTFADTSTVTVTAPAPTLRAIEVTPATVTLSAGASQTFSAIGRRTDNSTQTVSVNWTATGGIVTTGGVYTAGSSAGSYRVIAVQQGGTFADTSSITITVVPPSQGPDTIFKETFESGSLSQFQDGVDASKHTIINDASQAAVGNRYLQLKYAPGVDAGWLTRFFMPGYDSLYVRYYYRVQQGWTGGTKMLALRGSPTNNQWGGFGNAGLCPNGTNFFSSVLVNDGEGSGAGNLRFYAYYYGMRTESNGQCWGRYGDGTEQYNPPLKVDDGQWHKIEFFVKLNAPGSSDATQMVWVDGVLKGTWSGIRFRTSDILKLNSVQITGSATPGVTQYAYYDDLVVLKGRP